MGNIVMRCLGWILAVWIGSLGAALPATATVGDHAALGVTNARVVAAEAVTSDRRGDSDNKAILDDQVVTYEDAVSLAAVEDPQSPAAVVDVRHQRFAVAIDRSVFQSTSLVEPRFLRYRRLLN